jgi:hypothetical protein
MGLEMRYYGYNSKAKEVCSKKQLTNPNECFILFPGKNVCSEGEKPVA